MMGMRRYVQVCLDDGRFTSVDIDVGEPLVQGRWKNFRKRRRLVKCYRTGNLCEILLNMDYE
jgi:hypothetical protein